MESLQNESELENLPWQFRFEKLYRKLHGLPDNDPLLTGHCQTFIKAFEQILHEEISNREKEIAEEVGKIKLNVPHIECNTGECEPCDNCVAFQMANDRIDEVLKILNHNQ